MELFLHANLDGIGMSLPQMKKAECAPVAAHSAFVFPGPPGAGICTPVASLKLHREAPIDTVDPETVDSTGNLLQPQEGGLRRDPAILDTDGEAPAFFRCFDSSCI